MDAIWDMRVQGEYGVIALLRGLKHTSVTLNSRQPRHYRLRPNMTNFMYNRPVERTDVLDRSTIGMIDLAIAVD